MYVEVDTVVDGGHNSTNDIPSVFFPKNGKIESCLWFISKIREEICTCCAYKITLQQLFSVLEGYSTICCPNCRKTIVFLQDGRI